MDTLENALQPRPVRESKSEMVEIVLPNDANSLGALLGGRLMHWIDIAGALAAHRHSRSYVVTASIDHLDFKVPVHVGDLVIFQSSVNRAFRTSMESGVSVLVESYITGERRQVSSAYLTFVAVDRHGRKRNVPQVIPETDAEKRRFEDAGHRRDIRSAEKRERKRTYRTIQRLERMGRGGRKGAECSRFRFSLRVLCALRVKVLNLFCPAFPDSD